MSKFDEISKARKILELPEMATMAEIKSNYRRLLAKWHPDKRHHARPYQGRLDRPQIH
ncbi:MAG: DnaJ domain-containing protein [Deltaproteobacteria bacterium]|nr:DnaJ domain-containing protein [Deltaproteobacteria bacterium]